MNNNMERARKILDDEGYTCVIINNDNIYTSKERGVAPLLQWLETGVKFKGAVAADKVVGKAAAFLYTLLEVKEVYSQVISKPALEILDRANIKISYGEKVEAIRNRNNTGFCPMETAVWDINNAKDGLDAILATRNKLQSGHN